MLIRLAVAALALASACSHPTTADVAASTADRDHNHPDARITGKFVLPPS